MKKPDCGFKKINRAFKTVRNQDATTGGYQDTVMSM